MVSHLQERWFRACVWIFHCSNFPRSSRKTPEGFPLWPHTPVCSHTHTERDEDLQALKRGKINIRENIILLCNISPVVAVEVIEPAALFHQVYGSWRVDPGRIAVLPLVLFSLTSLVATLISLLSSPVIIIICTLSGADLALSGT